MTERVRGMFSEHRARILPVFIALTLMAGVIVTIFATQNAHADLANGCGYGYSSNGTYGTGTGFGYGTTGGGQYGYGNTYGCNLTITTTALPNGTAGSPYSAVLSASGGFAPYTWSGASEDALSISSNGTVSGTPSGSGNFTFTVTVTDSNGDSTTGPVTITVAQANSGGGGGGGGGGVTTTTVPTTTTTAPTTTTTAPTTTTTTSRGSGPGPLYIKRIVGHAIAGRTVTLIVLGAGFHGQPKVTSNAKYRVIVKVSKDNGVRLVIHIGSRVGVHGWHTLTFRLANGRVVKKNYLTVK